MCFLLLTDLSEQSQKPMHQHTYTRKYEQGCLQKHLHGISRKCVHRHHVHGYLVIACTEVFTKSTGVHGSTYLYIYTKGAGVHGVTSMD